MPFGEKTPAYRLVVRGISLYRANFAFAPLPQDRVHQRASSRLEPDSRAACHTFGPFFKSKVLSQSLPRRVARRVFAAGFGGDATGLSATAHLFTGKYLSQ